MVVISFKLYDGNPTTGNKVSWWSNSLWPSDVTLRQRIVSNLAQVKVWCRDWWFNNAKPVYGLATICHQARWLRWGHPSLFRTATSLLIWYKMFCVRDISYRLIWMEFINMFSVYAQSGTHSRFNWWIIVVLTYNPSVLVCVEMTDAPNSSGNVLRHGHLLRFQVNGR